MNHFSQEQWIGYLYDEDGGAEIRAHLQSCAECAAFADRLAADKALLGELAVDVPAREADYADRVWRSLASRLQPYPSRRRGFFVSWKLVFGLGLAAVAVVLATVAFYSGRLWEKKQDRDAALVDHGPATAQGRENIIVFVLDDHLDRSQRLLAELDDADRAAKDPELRKKAQELLAANRLYRVTTEQSQAQKMAGRDGAHEDDSLRIMLDDLEPVLVELANQPSAPDRRQIVRLRDNMRTNGLLFEIHILRAQERPSTTAHAPEADHAALRNEGKA